MSINNLTNKQFEIFIEVKSRLNKYSWFKGVCLDNFPTDDNIDRNRELAIEHVCMKTQYYDDPSLFKSPFVTDYSEE